MKWTSKTLLSHIIRYKVLYFIVHNLCMINKIVMDQQRKHKVTDTLPYIYILLMRIKKRITGID